MKLLYGYLVLTLFNYQPTSVFAQSSSAPATPEVKEILSNLSNVNTPTLKCTLNNEVSYVCDSMSTLACKPGTFDDGTGKVLSNEDYSSKVDPMKVKVKGFYQDSIYKMLKNSEPKYAMVRELALKTTNQTGTPDCSSSINSEINQCFERVSKILANKQMNTEFGYGGSPFVGGPFGGFGMNVSSDIDFASYSYLIENQVFKDSIQKAHEQSLEIVTDKKTSKKIENKIFPRVKKILIDKVTASVTDEKVRSAIIRKIENISYNGSDCSSMSYGNNGKTTMTGLMVENAFYDSRNQSFRFCNGFLLKNNSEFAIAMIIGHELSHSIDPCSITKPDGSAPVTYKNDKTDIKDYESQYPFKDLIGCLRSKESIAAKIDSQGSNRGGFGGLDSNPFCSNDQIGESFSDWMGSEILPEYISKHQSGLSQNEKVIGYSNVFRNFCGGDSSQFDVHPKIAERIDRIIMANRDTRKLVGCGELKSDQHYCKVGDGFVGTRESERKPFKMVVKEKLPESITGTSTSTSTATKTETNSGEEPW